MHCATPLECTADKSDANVQAQVVTRIKVFVTGRCYCEGVSAASMLGGIYNELACMRECCVSATDSITSTDLLLVCYGGDCH